MGRNTSSKTRFSSSSCFTTTAVIYATENEQIAPLSKQKTISVPVEYPPSENPIPIPVLLPESFRSAAAVKIQSAYRSHVVKRLVREIRAVNSEVGHFEELIRRQETVDAVRSDNLERLRVSEGLMSLLLRLDGVPGVNPSVRDLRRRVSRRIVALQEVLDAVSEARVAEADGFLPSWEEIFGGDCVGGDRENDGFCCEDRGLGLECLEKFLLRLRV